MQDERGARRVQEVMVGFLGTQALYAAARLQIADLLAQGPRTSDQLAAAVRADPGMLNRILHFLAGAGIFEADGDGQFKLNAAGEHLRTGAEGSMRELVLVFGEEFYRAAGNIPAAVGTGQDAFRLTFGRGLFEYLGEHPERARTFDRAMAAGTIFFASVPEVWDFSAYRTVVDVGGGTGAMLAAVLSRNPGLRGILFECESVAKAALRSLRAHGIEDRCEVVTGDFFEALVPADVCILSRILHDWTDQQCLTILQNCRAAINPQGRVLIVERLLPSPLAMTSDLTMLAVTGGRERTREEFRRLLARTRFELIRVIPLPLEVNLLEGAPAGAIP